MRKTGIIVGANFVVAVAPLHAGELSVETTVAYESRYVFRGVQYAESSFQPGITLGLGNFYGGVWLNLPIGDALVADAFGGEELDIFAGYTGSLNDTATIDIGVTYYTFPPLADGFFDLFEEDGDGLGANTVEAYAGLSFETILAPSLYIYRDFNYDTVTVEGGVSHSFPLAEKTSFDLGGALGFVIDDDAGGDYLYGAASVDVTFAVSDNGSIAAGVRYAGSDVQGGSIINDATLLSLQSSGFWWGVSVNASF